jgi:hypothetical protein
MLEWLSTDINQLWFLWIQESRRKSAICLLE